MNTSNDFIRLVFDHIYTGPTTTQNYQNSTDESKIIDSTAEVIEEEVIYETH